MKRNIICMILCCSMLLSGMEDENQASFANKIKESNKEAEQDRYVENIYNYLVELRGLVSSEAGYQDQKETTIFSPDYYKKLLAKINTFPSVIKIWDSEASYASVDSVQNNNNDSIKEEQNDEFKKLWCSFLTIIKYKKQWQANVENNVRIRKEKAVRSFDKLVAFRLDCMTLLKEFLPPSDNNESPLEKTSEFTPLSISRYNPFYWGNWYDRLHRSVNQLPSFPWREKKDSQEFSIAQTHCNNVRTYIDKVFKKKDQNEKYQICILIFYLLAMREMRIIIADFYDESRLVTWGLRGAGLLAGGLGLTALHRYLTHGKESNKK